MFPFWARRTGLDPPEPGPGLQFHRRHHCASHCRRLYPYRSWPSGHPRPPLLDTVRGAVPRDCRWAPDPWVCGCVLCTCLPLHETKAFRPGKEGDPVLSRSIWSLRAHGAWSAGHLLLRRCGGGPGLHCGELLHNAGREQRQNSFLSSLPLLARCHGGPPAWAPGS